jgi:predicted O-linked N-acetylglucosamine transferase (SPINDLY family)
MYQPIDIALDTFPYHGTTTDLRGIMDGSAVITLAGQTHASRVGVSLLTNCGCHDLIAERVKPYIDLATRLAVIGSDYAPPQTLRGRSRSPRFGDGRAFARAARTRVPHDVACLVRKF